MRLLRWRKRSSELPHWWSPHMTPWLFSPWP
jgi:hypothetical protein